jgi:hypothetical protein
VHVHDILSLCRILSNSYYNFAHPSMGRYSWSCLCSFHDVPNIWCVVINPSSSLSHFCVIFSNGNDQIAFEGTLDLIKL